MKPVYVFLAVVLVAHLVTLVMYPWTGAALIQFLVFLVLGAAVFGVFWWVAKILGRKAVRQYPSEEDLEPQDIPSLSVSRAAVICLALVVAQLLYLRLVAPHMRSFWAIEGIYYVILVVAGVVLANWARAPAPVGAVVATLAILAISVVSLVQFFGDPGVDFQYGPETWIFALQSHIGRMNMWPLDAACASGACLVAGAVRRLQP
jgi:hypothetical protein